MDDIVKRLDKLEARVSSLAEMVERVTISNATMLRAQQGVLDLQQGQTEALRLVREELARLSKAQRD
ncbi:hypothetical protein [Vineibacter terrae]|uniref:hypothetical protein n=1 Tax=Vineibacter terrae TaxID=2586908 RepID=UPI002E344441|nr:hypothetical protein [Vineibacter terrae]HEX2891216.1 hypothetical protein [Vineibacter terrae]